MKHLYAVLFLFCPFFTWAQTATDTQSSASHKMTNPSGQSGITVFPARILFGLNKGETASKTINVGNFTTEKYQLVIDFRDWTRDTLGKHVYTAKGVSRQSCASWITFDKPFMELGPGESTTVTVTMHVPDNDTAVAEMKWTMMVLKTATEKRPPVKGVKLAAQVEQVYGIGVHVLQTPPNISNKELKMLSFSPVPGPGNVYRIACKNIGGVELNAKFSIELSSQESGTKTTLDPITAPLFPQQSRYVDFTLPGKLPKGKYTAVALVDAEDDSVPIEAAEKEIVVK